MESTVRHQYDALLALKAPGSPAITATAVSNAIDIQRITKSPYSALTGAYGEGAFDVVVSIIALDTTSGSESYVVNFQTVDSTGSNPVTHESVTLTAAMIGASLVYGFHPKTLAVLDADAAEFRISVTLAGATPSLTYYAYIAPLSHA